MSEEARRRPPEVRPEVRADEEEERRRSIFGEEPTSSSSGSVSSGEPPFAIDMDAHRPRAVEVARTLPPDSASSGYADESERELRNEELRPLATDLRNEKRALIADSPPPPNEIARLNSENERRI
mmetsp:Transcript_62408/g.138994  ORF Transcript_62408/g.138994 Transcript_62408/m.138994 type:complete len:125 (-) Transcript_62408:274-648(-)